MEKPDIIAVSAMLLEISSYWKISCKKIAVIEKLAIENQSYRKKEDIAVLAKLLESLIYRKICFKKFKLTKKKAASTKVIEN